MTIPMNDVMTIPMNATAAFSYLCITVIFRNEFTVFLVVEQSSLGRKGQLQKCVIYFVIAIILRMRVNIYSVTLHIHCKTSRSCDAVCLD